MKPIIVPFSVLDGPDRHSAFNFSIADKEQLPQQTEGLPPKQADVVIIGAGYIGLSTALHLAESARAAQKNLNIVLLEMGRVGSGPSGQCMGHVGGGLEQADRQALDRINGPELAGCLVEHGRAAPEKVMRLIDRLEIPCGVQRGYFIANRDGTSSAFGDDQDDLFSIDPYPFVLGLAQRAREFGVEIYENMPVTEIKKSAYGFKVTTGTHETDAKTVVAAGGFQMGRTVKGLEALAKTDFPYYATTLVTDPLPSSFLKKYFPDGTLRPFCNDQHDVAYGSVIEGDRIAFGSCIQATERQPNFAHMWGDFDRIFPGLRKEYKKRKGRELGFQVLVPPTALDFTLNLLPHVGTLKKDLLFAHGLSGRGVALGIALGRGFAALLHKRLLNEVSPTLGGEESIIEDFSSIPHNQTLAFKALAGCMQSGLVREAALLQQLKVPDKIKAWTFFKKHKQAGLTPSG